MSILIIYVVYLMCCVVRNCILILRSVFFCMDKIVFLGYFVAAQGIEMDKEKVTTMWIGLHQNQ